MTLRVAITRSLPDAELTARAVKARGAEPVIAPLISIVPCLADRDVTGVQALLFTSANGVRVFAQMSPYRDRQVFTVGDTTARWAKAAGFTDVQSADGDSGALANLVIASLKPNDGRVLHISGDHVAGDVIGVLRRAGFDAERRIAYAAASVTDIEQIPPGLLEPLDIVLFHSPRAAETFLALGAPNAARLAAACLSEAVAAAAQKAPWRRVIVAPAPREDALLGAALQA